MKRTVLAVMAATAMTFAAAAPADAQLGGLLKRLAPKVELPNLLEGEKPVSTSIDDARYGDPSRDGFNPGTPAPMTGLQRDGDGGFVLAPGYWVLDAQSYCLKAGTYGPTQGDGYLYAPLDGSQRRAVEDILKNSLDHPDIAQRDIQVLLWAIVARAKFEDLGRDKQVTAARLLSRKQLAGLNRSAVDVLTSREVTSLVGGVPRPLAQVLEAEADMRRMLQGGSSFAELERVAVLTGAAPIGEGSRTDVPANRWSRHPDGFWIRYNPSGYSRTQVEIYVEQGSDAVGESYEPWKTVAVPVNTSKQRLGQSARIYGT